jgi:hypothetical protein
MSGAMAASSLLLCVAACVLWWRSYGRVDEAVNFRLDPEGRTWGNASITSADGCVTYSWREQGFLNPARRLIPAATDVRVAQHDVGWRLTSRVAPLPYPGDAWYQRLGFDWMFLRQRGRMLWRTTFLVQVPHAALAALLGIGPAVWVVRRAREGRARRRTRRGRCLQCGYDLRASAERCPECGTPVPATAGARA